MAVSLDTVARHAKDALWRDLDGEAVIVDLRSGTYFGLDAVGTRIWAGMEKGAPLREVLRGVTESFDVPEEMARADLLRLVETLLAKGLVEVA